MFQNPLRVEDLGDSAGRWRLFESLGYVRWIDWDKMPDVLRTALLDSANADWLTPAKMVSRGVTTIAGFRVEIPIDFVTDLASIPRLLRSIIDVNGKHRKDAVLHDFLYSKAPALSRAFCDREFLLSMAESGVRWTQRQAMHKGVRVGGWVAYSKYKRFNTAIAADQRPAD
jgi:hypothetical protein